MCGKDKTTMAILLLPLGSPLHVRERLILTFHRNLLIGITPACAGKTRIGIEGSVARGDHPRMCGKDLSFLKIQFSCRGSPPHVRERLYPDHSCILCGRITPACAGKTIAFTGYDRWKRDHPRMCGKDERTISDGLRL